MESAEKNGISCLPPLELVIDELKSCVHLSFCETVKNQRTGKSPCLKQTQIVIIVEDALSGSPEGIICPSIFGVGDDDMLSQQVKGLIENLTHRSFIAWHDQVRRIDHHFQAWGLHRGKQSAPFCGAIHHISPLRLKGQRHLFFLSDAQSSLHSA